MGSSFNTSDYVKSNVLNDVYLHATRYFEGTLIYGAGFSPSLDGEGRSSLSGGRTPARQPHQLQSS